MTSKEFRKEKDSLGELQVPASALYGVQTQRAVDNFPISGLRPWRAFVWSMAAIKRAAAMVNFELGLFNDREMDGKNFTAKQLAESIAQAGEEVMDGKWDAEFVVDPFQAGAGTSHNMNTNEVMANRATQILAVRSASIMFIRTIMSIWRNQRTIQFPLRSVSGRYGVWMSYWLH